MPSVEHKNKGAVREVEVEEEKSTVFRDQGMFGLTNDVTVTSALPLNRKVGSNMSWKAHSLEPRTEASDPDKK